MILFYSVSVAAILHYWRVYVRLSHIIKITYLLTYLLTYTVASLRRRLQLRSVVVVDLVLCGVGYHHAGLDVDDRKLMERMFSQGHLAVLSQFFACCFGPVTNGCICWVGSVDSTHFKQWFPCIKSTSI